MKTLADFKRRIAVGATITVIENTFVQEPNLGPRQVVKVQANGFAVAHPISKRMVWHYYQGTEGWAFDGSNRVTCKLAGRTGQIVYELLPPGQS